MSDEVLSVVPWDTIGVGGLAVLFAWLVMTGRLIPRATLERMLSERDARIAYMETANTAKLATMAALVEQNAKLSTQGELSLALLKSLQSIGSNANHPGSGHVASTQE